MKQTRKEKSLKGLQPQSFKNGRAFEDLVARFYETISDVENLKVTRNARVEGLDGLREIDLLIETKVAGHAIKIIVECKDYAGVVDVTKIDSLASKMQDVHASKAIMVTSKGYSKTAKKKAERCGIDLYTIGEALSPKWKPKIEMGVIIEEHLPSFDYHLTIRLEGITNLPARPSISGVLVYERLSQLWNEGLLASEDLASDELIKLLGIKEPYFIESDLGEKLPFSEFDCKLSFIKSFYYGNLNESEGTILMEAVSIADDKLIFDLQSLIGYREKFSKYTERSNIINSAAVYVQCISRPNLNILDMNASLHATRIGD